MAIEQGTYMVSFGSNAPKINPPKPSHPPTTTVRELTTETMGNIGNIRVFSANTIVTNDDGFPLITFTGKQIDVDSFVPVGMINIDSGAELRVNKQFIDTSYYDLTEAGGNIVASFVKDIGYTVDGNDTIEIRARLK